MCLCITLTNVEGSLYLGKKKNKIKGFLEDSSHHATSLARHYFKAAGSEVVMYMKTFQSCVPVASAWVRFGLRNKKAAKEDCSKRFLPGFFTWLWLTEQVKNPALGRRCWLGARSTSTAAGRSDPASIKRTASGGHLSIIVWWGQRAAELYSN